MKWFLARQSIGRILLFIGSLIGGVVGTGCSTTPSQVVQPLATLSGADMVDLNIVTGQLVFVPAYSEIFYGDASRTLPLTTTLAIHNTDPDDAIIIKSVRYFDTDGNLVQEYIEQPAQLKPMATIGFVIESKNTTGGWGANFLVEWGAEKPVYEPVIEAVMVSQQGVEGVSFISPGRVVSEQSP
jgi:hypothetical protein